MGETSTQLKTPFPGSSAAISSMSLPAVPSVLGFQNHHFNAVVSWAIDAKGEVTHAYA
jgi:hypothetical protein